MGLTKFNEETGQYEYIEKAKTLDEYRAQRKAAIQKLGEFEENAERRVQNAEWIYYDCVSSYDGPVSGYACSVCNSFVEDDCFEAEDFHKKYCGNCGAKMKGADDEQR